MLAVAFTVVAVVPMLFLGAWVERTAMKKELAAVSEKHLLLAGNITAALDRYAKDVVATFGYLIEVSGEEALPPSVAGLARQIGLRNFRIIDSEGRVTFELIATGRTDGRIPAEILSRLRPRISDGAAVFSDVMADRKGRPTIFLTRSIGPDRIAIGILDLDYVRQVQKAIAFGRKGHSAIVDRSGNVIAHPRADWQSAMKNLAGVAPVARMMAGESGVTTFFAPAVGKDMVTGYTTVPSTGWGVMVPQPVEELEERAGEVKQAALGLAVIGLAAAAIIGWLLSGLLVRPVEAVILAARGIAGGNLGARVPAPASGSPAEFRELGSAFNAMADDIAALITERKRAEDKLERSQFALDHASDAAVWLDGVGRIVYANPAAGMILGYSREELLALSVTDYDPDVSLDDFSRAFERTKARGPNTFEARHRTKAGIDVPVEVSVHYMRFGGDELMCSYSRDITERKRAEDALREGEKRLRDFSGASSDWFWEMDENLRFSYFSDRFTEVTGVLPEMLLGKTREETGVPGATPEEWQAHLATLAAHRPFRDFRHSRTHGDGRVVHLSINGKAIFDEESNFLGYRGTGSDITERKRAEDALRDSEARLNDSVRLAKLGYWAWDSIADRCLYVSEEHARMHGLSPDEYVARATSLDDEMAFIHPDDRETYRAVVEELRAGMAYDIKYRRLTADGDTRHVHEVGQPVIDGDGVVVREQGFIQDVTPSKQAEEALRLAKRNAEIANRTKSEFLANMSHELRTPLNAIIGFSDVMKGEMFGPVSDPKYAEYVSDINGSGLHLLDLINDILDLSKIEAGKTELHEETVDMAATLRSCLTLVSERAMEAELRIECDIPSNLPTIHADERKFKQILINLLSNAIKFTLPGGTIAVRLWHHRHDGLLLEIADTGIGIAPDDISKALTPFQQIDSDLNRKFDGTGLGLPLTKALTEAHGGSLDLQSELGVGTTATVRFPAERIIADP